MTITDTAAGTTADCTPADRVTKSLLGYGVIAGPFYVTVSLAQALTRQGFDLTRHSWSLLANGALGWIQIANFVLTGLMVVAGAIGMRRAMAAGAGARWVPGLVGAYGVALVAAGALRADPALGFPAGTPDGPGQVTWHGAGHLIAGGIGFLCVIAACFAYARRCSGEGRRGFAVYSRVTGAVFLAGFAGIASGSSAPALTLGFVAAVLVIWAWMSAVSVTLYRAVSAR